MSRTIPLGRILLFLILAVYLASGVYTVGQDEEGVVLIFGKPWKLHVPSGIHYAPPPPFGKKRIVRTTTAFQMSIGYKIADSVRGLPPSSGEVEFLTADTNILDVELILQYTIDDPFRFAFMVEDPHFLVRRVGEAAVTDLLARTGVDVALTSGRTSFLDGVRLGVQKDLRLYGVGVVVTSANMKRIEPPAEVIESFQDVQNAKADRERSINYATGYANEILPRARGEADAILSGADATRNARIEMARGEADRIVRLEAEYRKAPQITRERMYLETAERVLRNATLYVVDSDGGRNPVGVKLID